MATKDVISSIERVSVLLFLFVSINSRSAHKILESIILIGMVLLFIIEMCNLNFTI